MSKKNVFRAPPIVNDDFLIKTTTFDVDTISKDELIRILQTYTDAYFTADYDGNVYVGYHTTETQDEHDARVFREQFAVAQWQTEYAEWIENTERLRQERNKEAADQKHIRDQKYKDPEYIEFLRLQAKLKQKGIAV